MADKEQLIAKLQEIVTAVFQQADGHALQSRIFASQGLTKLEEKYAEHAQEEREYATKCIDRILDLGGEVKNEAKNATPIYTDALEWVKYDLQVSRDGLAWLKEIVELAKDDYTTYDLLKDYYKDEEDDMYWGEQQLELIEKIGVTNWYMLQV